jgi:hypothetical protein
MIKKCLVCGEEFKTYPSRIKIGRGKYCSKKCSHKITDKVLESNGENTRFKKGGVPHNKKGGTYTQARKGSKKYILLFKPKHPNASPKGYIRLHRYLMEKKIGRHLRENEVVHHKDKDTLNNSLDNLELMSVKEHCRLHVTDNILKRWT